MEAQAGLEPWSEDAVPIHFVDAAEFERLAAETTEPIRALAKAGGFEPKPGKLLLVPKASGDLARVLFGVEAADAPRRDLFLPGKLATLLPPGLYRFESGPFDPFAAALSFLLSRYKYARFVPVKSEAPRLCAPKGLDVERLHRLAAGVTLGRDLVNAPANELGPNALTGAALDLARRFGAQARVIAGEALLAENFPLIHAVGRGAEEPPHLVDFTHGPENGLKVTLVGKGVVFDSGGLDIKPGSAMALMKKDMGGAATALALAFMLMDAKLPLRLRVLLPIVENAVSARSYRPGDVYRSRKGLSVEIGDTDAEGRLVLADALALACEDEPDLIFDFATLTGAARVALGPEIAPFYTDDDALAQEIARIGEAARDPVWRMPLWDGYDSGLDGKIADLVNVTSGGFAGSITAALFLRRFVADARRWAHFDIYCWNPSARPGRPEGGEIPVARLLYDLIEARAREWRELK
ncbi:MAG TPA: leucyl aminopeptidase family protein [Methylocystis sp.]|nr:leucyl aminopeptidase family protein [Methylocystis sp.]